MIVVTGSDLPLGGAIAQALDALGHTVFSVRRATSLGHIKVRPADALAIVHADTHLHSARQRTAVDNNILGTRAVRGCAQRWDVPVIYLSSIVAQGPSKDGPHIATHPNAPVGVIARSLCVAEKLLVNREVDADVFRLAVPYGFDGSFDVLCKGLKKSALRPLARDVRLSFIHLEDIVPAILQRLDRQNITPFFGHLSDGLDRTGEDLLNAIERNGKTALRLPIGIPRVLWKITDRLSTPFGNWDMISHLSNGSNWTSRADHAENSFQFAPKVSWSEHINALI